MQLMVSAIPVHERPGLVLVLCFALLALVGIPCVAHAADSTPPGLAPSGQQGAYHNFRVAIYVVVGTTRQLADRRTLEEQYSRITRQLRFDKVYLEVYRNRQFAAEGSLEAIKKFFTD